MRDTVIVNSAYGKWYPQGQQRLNDSLDKTGYTGDKLLFTNDKINHYFKEHNLYTTKSAALFEAKKRGYRYILWLDCSLWAVKNTDKFFDLIKSEGYYFMRSGHNCAQTTNDHAARVSGFTHDELYLLPELWSCIFGFDLHNEQASKCFDLFLEYSEKGVFDGSREFNRSECSDSRFKFSRQDQTALSLAVHKCGITNIYRPNTHVIQDAKDGNDNDNTYFRMRGL